MEAIEIASYIDHTLLKPEATKDQIIKLCLEAKKYNFASACINPHWVSMVSRELENSKVGTCTVIGFPLGVSTSAVKALSAKDAVANGADELDMVINMGALKSGDWFSVEADIKIVVEAANEKLVKVILETCLLTDDEIKMACEKAINAGAGYVKTSTGFSHGGATVEAVRLMRKTVGIAPGVKASGGIRSTEDAMIMIEAGASRIGTSAGVEIVNGLRSSAEY